MKPYSALITRLFSFFRLHGSAAVLVAGVPVGDAVSCGAGVRLQADARDVLLPPEHAPRGRRQEGARDHQGGLRRRRRRQASQGEDTRPNVGVQLLTRTSTLR